MIALRIDWKSVPERERAQVAGNMAGAALRRAFPEGKLEQAPGGRAWATWVEGITVVCLAHGDVEGTFAAWAGHGLEEPAVPFPHSNDPDAALGLALRDLMGVNRTASGAPLSGDQLAAVHVAAGRMHQAVLAAARATDLARLPRLPIGLAWRAPRGSAGTVPRTHIVNSEGVALCGLAPRSGWHVHPMEVDPDRLCRRCCRRGAVDQAGGVTNG